MPQPDPGSRAFPSSSIDPRYGGMTLWDWFAGQALVGISALPTFSDEQRANSARICASMADAMMAERRKHERSVAEADAAIERPYHRNCTKGACRLHRLETCPAQEDVDADEQVAMAANERAVMEAQMSAPAEGERNVRFDVRHG